MKAEISAIVDAGVSAGARLIVDPATSLARPIGSVNDADRLLPAVAEEMLLKGDSILIDALTGRARRAPDPECAECGHTLRAAWCESFYWCARCGDHWNERGRRVRIVADCPMILPESSTLPTRTAPPPAAHEAPTSALRRYVRREIGLSISEAEAMSICKFFEAAR